MFIVSGGVSGELRQEFNVSRLANTTFHSWRSENRQRPRDYKHSTTTWLSDSRYCFSRFSKLILGR